MNAEAASLLFGRLDRSLWLVTACAGGRRGGLIATFVNEASIVPTLPRVVVGLARQHQTWELVEESGGFGLHLIGEDQIDWVWRFGLESGRDRDKLEGLANRPGASGCPILVAARGWLDCRVEARLDTGDRTLFLAEVLDASAPDDRPTLTVKRMLQLAPTETRREMEAQLGRDRARDTLKIQDWRRRHPPPSGAPGP